MDLLSVMSCSNNTTSSNQAELIEEGQDTFNELAAYYTQIIHDIKTAKAKPIKKYQTRLDENSHRIQPSNPPSTKRNYSGNIVINPPSTKNKNNRNIIIDDHREDYFKSSTEQKLPKKSYPRSTPIFQINEASDSDHGSCSTNLSKKDNDTKTYHKNNTNQIVGPSYAEKTTYCRPAVDMFSQDFIFKTMQRNARLKGLVRRIVLAREREKQKVAWNNYINELKNKHRYDNPEHGAIPNYMPDNTEIIDDYYNTRFTWQQSNPCQNLLQDFYSASDEMSFETNKAPNINRPLGYRPYTFKSSRFCFPTSSQARLMMRNQERDRNGLSGQSYNSASSRYDGIPIFVDKETNDMYASKPIFKNTQSYRPFNFRKQFILKNISVQTDFNSISNNVDNDNNSDNNTKETFKDKYSRISSNVERLKQKITRTQNEVKNCSLLTIENKLDSLIQSINTFIVEMKSQNPSKNEDITCQLSNGSKLINSTKSDTFGLLRRDDIVCGNVQERPRSTITFKEGKRNETINEILYEEMRKSNKVKRDIEEILSKPSHERPSVHITFDLPTKERATEITDSLYKTRQSDVVVEDIGGHSNRMTIAVNTDPLGLLALFRVSAETVKQILSYMPHIDYCSYLSRLPLPQVARNEMSNFVCNICGAAFDRPSQLSDHIQQHNLGNARDCCVCRHVLDMRRHRAGLFSCQHCGQRFTRAYCRELHEQECGKTLGRRPEESSSLMLLR